MGIENFDNKQFAFHCLNLLKNSGNLNSKTLNILTNAELCKKYFSASSNFAVLKKVQLNISKDELKECCSVNGRLRYYQNLFIINSEAYVVTNHWYGPGKSMPDNRTPFLRWVENICSIQ